MTVYHAFFQFGPGLRIVDRRRGRPRPADVFRSLVATDASQQSRAFLSTEESFGFLKDLESRNMLVPVVGNFAGPKAIRAVGKYLKKKGTTVSAFYLSNVEQYLRQDGIWRDFCANVATLPLDEASTFIRSVRGGRYGQQFGFGLNSDLGGMAAEVKSCPPASVPRP
jgi:hypothetical protein